MGIGIPLEMDCRKSDRKPLDLLKDARADIDKLSDKFGFLASNSDVQQIYAQLDGAIFKLEGAIPEIKREAEEAIEDDGKPLDAMGAAKLAWEFLTRED